MWALGSLGSIALACVAGLALMLNVVFNEVFNSARLGAVVAIILALHLLRFPRVVFTREAILYALFLAYMFVEMLWTSDTLLALNTLVPASNFVLILILYGSLMAFHDQRAVLVGSLFGFLLGAATYTAIAGFPFAYPAEFSYNAIAAMYLFGLFVSLLLASHGRLTAVYIAIATGVVLHIMATTSIKTNLGVLFGIMAVGVVYFRYLAHALRRNVVIVLVLIGGLIFAMTTNEGLVETVRRGADRVSLGIEVLQAREDIAGYSSFELRSTWQRDGLVAWAENPLFGYGVEAFRSKYGITSHATFIDLLYNSGLIGFALFYGVLISVMLRLYRASESVGQGERATILATIVCYVFITLSGNIHYSSFLAVFIAISASILSRSTHRQELHSTAT